jgi:hypothetical protein
MYSSVQKSVPKKKKNKQKSFKKYVQTYHKINRLNQTTSGIFSASVILLSSGLSTTAVVSSSSLGVSI